MMRFKAHYGYHPSTRTKPTTTNILSTRSVTYRDWIKAVVQPYKKVVHKFSTRMKKYIQTNLTMERLIFEPRNLVILNRYNIKPFWVAWKLNMRYTDYLRYITSNLLQPYISTSPICGRSTQYFMYPSLQLLSRIMGMLI
jgi:hypothetical protein